MLFHDVADACCAHCSARCLLIQASQFRHRSVGVSSSTCSYRWLCCSSWAPTSVNRRGRAQHGDVSLILVCTSRCLRFLHRLLPFLRMDGMLLFSVWRGQCRSGMRSSVRQKCLARSSRKPLKQVPSSFYITPDPSVR